MDEQDPKPAEPATNGHAKVTLSPGRPKGKPRAYLRGFNNDDNPCLDGKCDLCDTQCEKIRNLIEDTL